MISINNNVLNLKLSNSILKSMQSLTTSLQRIMTGLKINSPADNPSGFYISSNLATQIKGLETANNNIQTAINLLGIADDSIDEINNIMGEIRDLVSKSTNEYMTPAEREANQEKINKLFAQAKQIKDSAEYNGNKLFSNSIILDKNTTYKDNPTTTTTNYSIREAQIVTTAAGMTLNRLGDRPATTSSETSTTNEPTTDETNTLAASSADEEVTTTETTSTTEPTAPAMAPAMAPRMMVARSMAAPAAYSSSYDVDLGTSGSYSLSSGQTITAMINGQIYTITNNSNYTEYFIYETDSATGQITMSRSYNNMLSESEQNRRDLFTVTAASGQTDNIKWDITNGTLYTGDMDDTITVFSTTGAIYSGDGNDNVTITTSDNNVYTEGGDDTVTLNNTYSNTIDGGTGINTLIDNSGNSSNTITNFGPNIDSLQGSQSFTQNETKQIQIGDKSYTVTNKLSLGQQMITVKLHLMAIFLQLLLLITKKIILLSLVIIQH